MKPAALLAMPPSRASSLAGLCLLVLIFLGVSWFYAWAPESFPIRWTSREATGLYQEQGDALLAGQLYLQRQPAPELVAMAHPYDPSQNAAYRVNDVSYFRGHYYLYHGLAPVVTLFAPFKLLTGQHLTESAATLIFCLGGCATSFLLLYLIWKRYCPASSLWAFFCCALILALGDGYQAVLRGTQLNNVAIASAYFFLMLALLCLVQALHSSRRPWPWLAAASLAYGLTVASRPNYAFGTAALLLPFLFHWKETGFRWSQSLLEEAVATVLPVTIVAAALVYYNWVRFHNPLEFGLRYQLGGWDQQSFPNFNRHSIAQNLWYYLIAPGTYHAEFPFVTGPGWTTIGVLQHAPFVGLALLLVPALFRGDAQIGNATQPLRIFAGAVLVIFLAIFTMLLLLPSGDERAVLASANSRYLFDFQPSLALLAVIGALTAAQWASSHFRLRRRLTAVILVLTGATLVIAMSMDLARFPVESYRALAEKINLPTRYFQQWFGSVYGPIHMQVVFSNSPGKTAAYEPLVCTGNEDEGDLVYVYYAGPNSICFGLVGTEVRGPLSPPIPVPFGVPHQIDVSMGSLYPPTGHPLLSPFSDTQVALLRRDLHIQIDGKDVYDTPAHFHQSSSREVSIGSANFLLDYSAPRFSGQITQVRRLPIAAIEVPRDRTPEFGPVRMVVRFPADKAEAREPLVVTGAEKAGDFIYVVYHDEGMLQFGFDHWGRGGKLSPPIPVDLAQDHVLEISLGALFPPAGHRLLADASKEQRDHWKQEVRVVLDGRIVLFTVRDTYESSPFDVFVGKNIIGGSTCGYIFSGEIKQIARLPWPTSLGAPP